MSYGHATLCRMALYLTLLVDAMVLIVKNVSNLIDSSIIQFVELLFQL